MKELTEEIWKKYHPEEKKYSDDDSKKPKRLRFLRRLADHSVMKHNRLATHDNSMMYNNLAMHDQMHRDAVNSHAIATMGHPIM